MEQTGTKNKMDILNASPKEKAIAYCLDFADPYGAQEYTKEESVAILESLSPDDRKIFFKWTRLYAVFAKIIPDFSLFHREYVLSVREVERLLNDISSKELELAHLQFLRSTMDANLKREFDKAVGLLFNTDKIDPLTFKEVNIETDPDGDPQYIPCPTSQFKENLQTKITTMAYFGCLYSSYAKALSIWINQKKAAPIVPPMLKDLLSAYKEKSHQSVIMNYYSVSGIKDSEKRGDYISRPRREISEIMPLFKDVATDQKEVIRILDHLNKTLDETGKKN